MAFLLTDSAQFFFFFSFRSRFISIFPFSTKFIDNFSSVFLFVSEYALNPSMFAPQLRFQKWKVNGLTGNFASTNF